MLQARVKVNLFLTQGQDCVQGVTVSWGAGLCRRATKVVMAIRASSMSPGVVMRIRTRLTCSWMPPPGGGSS